MIKPEYKCVKSWTFTRPNGEDVVIFIGDTVKVFFDVKTCNFSDWFLEKLNEDDNVEIKVLELSARKIEGNVIDERFYHFTQLRLEPKNIIDIVKI